MKFSEDLQKIGYTVSSHLEPIENDMDFVRACIDSEEAANLFLVFGAVMREMSDRIEELEGELAGPKHMEGTIQLDVELNIAAASEDTPELLVRKIVASVSEAIFGSHIAIRDIGIGVEWHDVKTF